MLHVVQPGEVKAMIGQNVAQHRARLGWSQAELAERWGRAMGRTIDPTTVTRLERGRRPITVDELMVLTNVMGLRSTEDLTWPPEQVHLVARLRDIGDRLNERYDRIVKTAMEYLSLQVMAQRQIEDAKKAGLLRARELEAWIDQPPESAVISARLVLKDYANELERAQVARERGRQALAALAEQGIAADPPSVETPIAETVVTGTGGVRFHFAPYEMLDVTETPEEKRKRGPGVTIANVEHLRPRTADEGGNADG